MHRPVLAIASSLFALTSIVACGGKLDDPNAGNGDRLGGEHDETGPDAAVAPGADAIVTSDVVTTPDPTCTGEEYSARLAEALTTCSSPIPTRATSTDRATSAEFRAFVVGRWLACPSSTGPAFPGPKGSVGLELTADGRAYFLKVDCAGNVVRGEGTAMAESGPPTAWEDWYDIYDDTGQMNVYYGGPPGSFTVEQIGHPKFDGSPRRMWVENMGVYHSMYVPAPSRL